MSGPPGWTNRLLSRLLPAADEEPVLEELQELYRMRVGRFGIREADRWYRRQALVFAWHLIRDGRSRGVRTGRTAFQAAMNERRRKGGVGMGDLVMEVRLAARRLLRVPVFAVVSVATVGVAIGAFTSIFALAEAVLLEEMPYERPSELAWVWRDYVEADFPRGWLGGPEIAGMRERSEVFSGVVAFRSGAGNLTGADGTSPARVRLQRSSYELFDVLGVQPAMGRGFVAADDEPGAAAVAVLSHRFWNEHFGADPETLGSRVFISGESTEVVGIMGADFRFVKHGSLSDPVGADLYVPLREVVADQDPGSGMYAGLVRIVPETGADQIASALDRSIDEVNVYMRQYDASPVRLWTVDLTEDLVAGVRPALIALAASAGFLMLILSANLATLLLGRAGMRERELGVRVALGAARSRVLSSVVAESVLITGLGGALGLALAWIGIDLVVALAPADLPRLDAVELDASVVGVAVLVAGLMALVAGIVPALLTLRVDVARILKDGDGRSGGSARTTRTRDVLVAAQVALSLMLLVGAGLTASAFSALLEEDPGFDAESALTFTVPVSEIDYPTPDDQAAFHEGILTRFASLPGVRVAGATTALPLTAVTNQRGVGFPDSPTNTGIDADDGLLVDWFRATPGYFEAAGFRLLEGRSFDRVDSDTTTFNLIIDDVLARRFYPDGGALGARVAFLNDTATVVGVVDQARLYSVYEDDRGQVFVPFRRLPNERMSFVLRTEVDPVGLVAGVRAIVNEADPSVPVSDVRTLEGIVGDSLGEQRLSLTLILAFAFGAVLLAALGLYGVVSNTVTSRSREIAVRVALGAHSDDIVRMVLRRGLKLTLLGTAIGLAGAWAARGVLRGLMVGVESRDPMVYLGVAAALVLVAVFASWIPARRATRIDPVEALSES